VDGLALRKINAVALVVLFLMLGAVHVYWAFGGRRGASAAIPEVDGRPAFHPGRAVTLVVALLLSVAAAIIAFRSNLLSAGSSCLVVRVGAWTLSAVFALRAVGNFRTVGFFKARRDTAFARYDTILFSPLCLAIGVGCFYVALGP
jgi:hypothetical protein